MTHIPLNIKDPADRFDLSYVFANNFPALGKDKNALVEMSAVAREVSPGVSCRAALVHPGEIKELVELLRGSNVRPEVVIDFPDGLGGIETKDIQSQSAHNAGAIGGDIVINTHQVQARDKKAVADECLIAVKNLKEVKAIAQIPYLWQYDKEAITWLLDILAETGIYAVKDWTTRENFLLPDGDSLDSSLETRLRYLEFMAEYIRKKSLPLYIKIAGRATADNVRSFINAGATLIGLSYRKAPLLRDALISKQ